MSIKISPMNAALGAEVTGFDVCKPLSGSDKNTILQAWHDHLILVIPEQPMNDEQLMAFTRNFGELEYSAEALVKSNYQLDSVFGSDKAVPPEIAVVSNIVKDGAAIGVLGSGEAFWHTDSSFVDIPPDGSLLHALEVPSTGGDTHFLNMYRAYETLPASVQRVIANLRANHSISHTSAGEPRKGFENVTDVTTLPGAQHPLVRTHPATGRNALFLGRRLNAYIVGLPVDESEDLLNQLWAHTINAEYTVGHHWRVGDTVIWDNRCAMHRRDSFDPDARRLMHRTQLKGTRPFYRVGEQASANEPAH
ncbi:TauD/TfdA dioxygenase family protein [Paraburkholderia caffeinilytica]|uniref:TauD/TfdA dioxygenase family protein n=1 Tax=Paraburkholderia caffeinilytica TaxID=1761016 RepID=UPI0038BB9839